MSRIDELRAAALSDEGVSSEFIQERIDAEMREREARRMAEERQLALIRAHRAEMQRREGERLSSGRLRGLVSGVGGMLPDLASLPANIGLIAGRELQGLVGEKPELYQVPSATRGLSAVLGRTPAMRNRGTEEDATGEMQGALAAMVPFLAGGARGLYRAASREPVRRFAMPDVELPALLRPAESTSSHRAKKLAGPENNPSLLARGFPDGEQPRLDDGAFMFQGSEVGTPLRTIQPAPQLRHSASRAERLPAPQSVPIAAKDGSSAHGEHLKSTEPGLLEYLAQPDRGMSPESLRTVERAMRNVPAVPVSKVSEVAPKPVEVAPTVDPVVELSNPEQRGGTPLAESPSPGLAGDVGVTTDKAIAAQDMDIPKAIHEMSPREFAEMRHQEVLSGLQSDIQQAKVGGLKPSEYGMKSKRNLVTHLEKQLDHAINANPDIYGAGHSGHVYEALRQGLPISGINREIYGITDQTAEAINHPMARYVGDGLDNVLTLRNDRGPSGEPSDVERVIAHTPGHMNEIADYIKRYRPELSDSVDEIVQRVGARAEPVAESALPQHVDASIAPEDAIKDIASYLRQLPPVATVKDYQKYLVAEIKKSIENAPSAEENLPVTYVTFETPGYGTYKIVNTRESLQDFAKEIGKNRGFSNNPSSPMRPGVTNPGKYTSREFMTEGDYLNAAEYGRISGDEILYGGGHGGATFAYTDVAPLEGAVIEGLDLVTARSSDKQGRWAVMDRNSGLSVGGVDHKTRKAAEDYAKSAIAKMDQNTFDRVSEAVRNQGVSQAELEARFNAANPERNPINHDPMNVGAYVRQQTGNYKSPEKEAYEAARIAKESTKKKPKKMADGGLVRAITDYGDSMNRTADDWADWKHANPWSALALEVIPGPSSTTSLWDANKSTRDAVGAYRSGDYPKAAGKAGETIVNLTSGLSGIPSGLTLAKAASAGKAIPALRKLPIPEARETALAAAKSAERGLKAQGERQVRREFLTEGLSDLPDWLQGLIDTPEGTYNPFR